MGGPLGAGGGLLSLRCTRFHAVDDDAATFSDEPVSDFFGHRLVADLYGRPQSVTCYRQGGVGRFGLPVVDDPEPQEPWGSLRTTPDELELYEIVVVMERSRTEGRTEKQLRTIRALWLERITLREHARREGVSSAAIHARVAGSRGAGGLLKLVPEFGAFWIARHAGRRRRR